MGTNKNIIIGILAIGTLLLLVLGGRYLLDTGRGNFQSFPSEIRQKHSATIEKVDALITKENGNDEVTSRSEKFNLENYLGVIEIGVLPYLENNDVLKQDIQLLVEDIRKYIAKAKLN